MLVVHQPVLVERPREAAAYGGLAGMGRILSRWRVVRLLGSTPSREQHKNCNEQMYRSHGPIFPESRLDTPAGTCKRPAQRLRSCDDISGKKRESRQHGPAIIATPRRVTGKAERGLQVHCLALAPSPVRRKKRWSRWSALPDSPWSRL